MIYIVTALYCEAAPFISLYKMKKQLNHQNCKFDIFKGDNAILIISGTGAAKVIAATSFLMTLFPFTENDLLVNIGVCGIQKNPLFGIGEVILCNKLKDSTTGKCFYPRIIKKHPFFESELVSSSQIVTQPDYCAADMEAAFFYQASLMFVPSERVIVIKIASDVLGSNASNMPDKHTVEKLVGEQSEIIAGWLNSYDSLEYLPLFSHIYVEQEAEKYNLTRKIKEMYPNSQWIQVKHYKDVFSPKNQDFSIQKHSRKLLLAVKKSGFLYEGSPMCDSFGNENFYYASDVLNCVYNCDYCYLQGMYDSANITVFVNIDDTLSEAERLLKEKPLYVCISYNTDMLAIENITGYVRKWLIFAQKHRQLSLEIRTKSANFNLIKNIEPNENIVFAWTVSPEEITSKYEHKTPSLLSRIQAAKEAAAHGWKIRLCIDPMLYIDGHKKLYEMLDKTLNENIDIDSLCSLSRGEFRVSKNYFKKMKRLNRDSEIYNYEFINDGGYMKYKESAEGTSKNKGSDN